MEWKEEKMAKNTKRTEYYRGSDIIKHAEAIFAPLTKKEMYEHMERRHITGATSEDHKVWDEFLNAMTKVNNLPPEQKRALLGAFNLERKH